MFSDWYLPLIPFALGVALAAYGCWLLVEYRKLFFADAPTIATLEVLTNLLQYGSGPGYLIMLTFIGSAVLIFVSVLTGSEYLGHLIGWIIRAEWSAPRP